MYYNTPPSLVNFSPSTPRGIYRTSAASLVIYVVRRCVNKCVSAQCAMQVCTSCNKDSTGGAYTYIALAHATYSDADGERGRKYRQRNFVPRRRLPYVMLPSLVRRILDRAHTRFSSLRSVSVCGSGILYNIII